MTTAALAPVTLHEGITHDDALFDVMSRARAGDAEALAFVFDNAFYEVYHHVFLVTRDRRETERATRHALDRLPAMLRSRRYRTLTELRDALVYRARQDIRRPRRVRASAGGMEDLRAVIRHLVLISAASIAAAGALVLAL